MNELVDSNRFVIISGVVFCYVVGNTAQASIGQANCVSCLSFTNSPPQTWM